MKFFPEPDEYSQKKDEFFAMAVLKSPLSYSWLLSLKAMPLNRPTSSWDKAVAVSVLIEGRPDFVLSTLSRRKTEKRKEAASWERCGFLEVCGRSARETVCVNRS